MRGNYFLPYIKKKKFGTPKKDLHILLQAASHSLRGGWCLFNS